MPLTNPEDYPSQNGIDPRDENHPMFPRKPQMRVYLKPMIQKVIEKNQWVELIALFFVLFAGMGELFGRQLSSGFYFAMGVVLTVLIWRFINIENETHAKHAAQNSQIPEETQPEAGQVGAGDNETPAQ